MAWRVVTRLNPRSSHGAWVAAQRWAIAVLLGYLALTQPWPWLVPVTVFGCVVLCIRGAMRWPQLGVALLAGATVFALAFDAFFMADRLPSWKSVSARG